MELYLGYKPMQMIIRKTVDKEIYQIVKLGNEIKESDELEFKISNKAIDGTPKAGDLFRAEVRYNSLIEKLMPFKENQFKRILEDNKLQKTVDTLDKAINKLNSI